MSHCSSYYLSEEEAAANYEADLIVFVIVITDNSSTSIASTSVCGMEGIYNRPIFAKMSWNLANADYFNDVRNIGIEGAVEIVLHEMMHALGFMNPLWSFYVDPLTSKLYNYTVVDRDQFFLSLPRLVFQG
jgi:hypothetical protein